MFEESICIYRNNFTNIWLWNEMEPCRSGFRLFSGGRGVDKMLKGNKKKGKEWLLSGCVHFLIDFARGDLSPPPSLKTAP